MTPAQQKQSMPPVGAARLWVIWPLAKVTRSGVETVTLEDAPWPARAITWENGKENAGADWALTKEAVDAIGGVGVRAGLIEANAAARPGVVLHVDCGHMTVARDGFGALALSFEAVPAGDVDDLCHIVAGLGAVDDAPLFRRGDLPPSQPATTMQGLARSLLPAGCTMASHAFCLTAVDVDGWFSGRLSGELDRRSAAIRLARLLGDARPEPADSHGVEHVREGLTIARSSVGGAVIAERASRDASLKTALATLVSVTASLIERERLLDAARTLADLGNAVPSKADPKPASLARAATVARIADLHARVLSDRAKRPPSHAHDHWDSAVGTAEALTRLGRAVSAATHVEAQRGQEHRTRTFRRDGTVALLLLGISSASAASGFSVPALLGGGSTLAQAGVALALLLVLTVYLWRR